MVKIVDFKVRTNSSDESFCVLVVQGGVRPIVSKETGKVYLTNSRANVPTTFDEQTCKELIGEKLEGSIEKVDCEPYEYTVESSGEVIELSHRYEFQTAEQKMQLQVIDEELVI